MARVVETNGVWGCGVELDGEWHGDYDTLERAIVEAAILSSVHGSDHRIEVFWYDEDTNAEHRFRVKITGVVPSVWDTKPPPREWTESARAFMKKHPRG